MQNFTSLFLIDIDILIVFTVISCSKLVRMKGSG